jgi:hypothetical protein
MHQQHSVFLVGYHHHDSEIALSLLKVEDILSCILCLDVVVHTMSECQSKIFTLLFDLQAGDGRKRPPMLAARPSPLHALWSPMGRPSPRPGRQGRTGHGPPRDHQNRPRVAESTSP